jgi:hypothetical protein
MTTEIADIGGASRTLDAVAEEGQISHEVAPPPTADENLEEEGQYRHERAADDIDDENKELMQESDNDDDNEQTQDRVVQADEEEPEEMGTPMSSVDERERTDRSKNVSARLLSDLMRSVPALEQLAGKALMSSALEVALSKHRNAPAGDKLEAVLEAVDERVRARYFGRQPSAVPQKDDKLPSQPCFACTGLFERGSSIVWTTTTAAGMCCARCKQEQQLSKWNTVLEELRIPH